MHCDHIFGNLEVISSGGNGHRGQDGGDGAAARDSKDVVSISDNSKHLASLVWQSPLYYVYDAQPRESAGNFDHFDDEYRCC